MKRKVLLLLMLLAVGATSAWAQDAYYSYSNISSSYSGSSLYNNGTPTNLLDNSLSSKYCPVYNNDTWPSHSYVDFESNDLIIPTGYVIYTGDDTQQYPGRNPKNWTIQAKVNSNDSWQTIHTVTNAGLPATNKTEVSYSFSNTTAYKYFRIDITAIVSGGIGQLQDFHFIATVQGGGGTDFVLNQNLEQDLTCGGSTYKFYDSGNTSGNYSNSENYTATFTCTGDITINFSTFATESTSSSDWDNIKIYDGTAENGTKLVFGCTGYTAISTSSSNASYGFQNLLTTNTNYTATSGIMTIVWKSDSSNTAAGWDATITTGTCRYITEIYTKADWEAFCTAVNNGHDYSGETVTLMNDITTAVTTMAGVTTGESTYNYAFKGTFDGQGHTLTVNLTSGTLSGDWYYTAPFRVIDGATIKNLKTTGTVTQNSGKGAAGLAGYTTGTCTITNCVSNVTINSLTDGDGTHGGFFSEIRGTTTMNNCAFTGSITGSSTRYCGGFVGWKSGTATFNNCVFAPTAITFDADHSGDNSANFSRNGGTFNNCYYTQTCGSVVQGKLMHSITGASGITVANAGTATSYTPETSTIVGYGTGIKFNNILYAANNENVSLNLSASTSGIFYADNATITGNSNPYTLAMPNEDVVVRIAPALTITATANPAAGGSVTGSGTFAQGSSCTLTATANTGYAFANWTKNNVVVSTNASYTFTVSEDATYMANFEPWGVSITSTPASVECISSGTQVTLVASTNFDIPSTPSAFGFEVASGTYSSISGTSSVSGDDVYSSAINIGFTFNYCGVDYTTAVIATNGYLKLVGNSSNSYSNDLNSSSYYNILAAFWDDLDANSTKYTTTGTEPNRVFVMQHDGYRHNDSGNTFSYQIRLYETTNVIEFWYGSGFPNVSNSNTSASIGLNNRVNGVTSFISVTPTGSGTATTSTTTANNSIGTTQCDYLTSGTIYRFTPPVPYEWSYTGTAGTANGDTYTVTPTENSTYTVTMSAYGQTYSETVEVNIKPATPSNLVIDNIGLTTATASWSGSASNYAYSIDNGTTWTTTSNTSVDLTGLTQGQTYTFQVKAVNGDCESEVVSESFTTINNVTITKTIIGHDDQPGRWYLITSPLNTGIAPTAVTNMIPRDGNDQPIINSVDYDLFYFDQAATDGLEWRNFKDEYNSFTELVPGTGYLYANKETVILEFTGVPYQDNGIVTLRYSEDNQSTSMRGWNLVGNPLQVEASLDCYYYVMNDAGTEIVLIWRNIAPMEGVFVKCETDGSTVTFNPVSGSKNAALALNVTQGRGLVDCAAIGFDNKGSLPKFQLNPNHTKIYIPQSDKDYAVVSAESDMGEMPVNFKAEKNGTYTISANADEVSFNYLHLIDNLTGADVDLLANPSYSFNATTTDYASRFRLVFATANSDDDNFGFYNGSAWVINNDGEAVLQVVDVMGRILKSESINGCATVNFNAAPGVYMLRLINGENEKVQKVIVR